MDQQISETDLQHGIHDTGGGIDANKTGVVSSL
jgi:hypothetical protein